jgi:hypothetical protein
MIGGDGVDAIFVQAPEVPPLIGRRPEVVEGNQWCDVRREDRREDRCEHAGRLLKNDASVHRYNPAVQLLRWLTSRDRFPSTLATLVLLIYVAAVGAVAAQHEPWRDEADGWLIARDGGAGDLIEYTRHGGTPALWHLLLIPLAKAGAPYRSEHVLHLLIAAGTAALVLWRAPFPRIARFLTPFSYYFAYEYAVIARSYALSVLLLFVAAALYGRRYERPIAYAATVALLANTNIHSLLIAALIGLAYLLEGEGKNLVRPISIMLAGGLAALAQVWPARDAMVHGAVSVFHPDAPLRALLGAFFPLLIMPHVIGIGAALVILIAALFAVRHSRGGLLILCGSYAALAYVFIFKWLGGVRHFGFVLVLLLFVLWIGDRGASVAYAICWSVLTISLAVSVAGCVVMSSLDWRFAFSGASEMAGFVRDRGMSGYTIAAHSETTTSALCPYFDHPFWFAGIEDLGTFSRWDARFSRGLEVTYPEAVRRVAARFPNRSPVLLLLNVEMPAPERNGWRLLYHNRRPQFANPDESFWLYGAL